MKYQGKGPVEAALTGMAYAIYYTVFGIARLIGWVLRRRRSEPSADKGEN